MFPDTVFAVPDVGYMRALSPEGVLSVNPSAIIAIQGSGPKEAVEVLKKASVPYVDSCGLGTMVQSYVSARRAGGSVRLLNVTPRVRHLLTITRLLTVFDFYRPEVRAVGA